MKREIVMIKPDAFDTFVDKNLITAFFVGIADFLQGTNNIDSSYLHYRDNAIKQIKERAIEEESFQGELSVCDANRLNTNIVRHLSKVKSDFVDSVIVDCLSLLNFDVIADKEYVLTHEDVSRIYSLIDDDDLSIRLHDYLDNKTVKIIALAGENDYLLQWIKTFVRNFFIKNREERFPLKNLIHVCEEDYKYLEEIVLNH